MSERDRELGETEINAGADPVRAPWSRPALTRFSAGDAEALPGVILGDTSLTDS